MDSLPNFLTHGAPLRARFAPAGAPLVILFYQIHAQGLEEMRLSLEHQNPSKTSENMADFDRVTVSLHAFYIPQTKRLRARKIGLESNTLGVQSSE